MCFLAIFGHFLELFFSKISFGPKSLRNEQKWFFGASLGPKDDPYMILDQFGQTKILTF